MQSASESLIPENVTDVNLGVPASTYKLQVGFRRSGLGYDRDLCNFSQDWGVTGDGSRQTDGLAAVGYLNSVTAKLGSATTLVALASRLGQFLLKRATAMTSAATPTGGQDLYPA
eukprot:COSAG02_NODE_2180_length_9587_cov_3.009275_6_plen_115_part_00